MLPHEGANASYRLPDDSDARDYRVSFDRCEQDLGFKAEHAPADGAREIYEALKLGRVDTGPKTITVKWYQHIMDAKRLVDGLALDGRLLWRISMSNGIFPAISLQRQPLSLAPKRLLLYLYIYAPV